MGSDSAQRAGSPTVSAEAAANCMSAVSSPTRPNAFLRPHQMSGSGGDTVSTLSLTACPATCRHTHRSSEI